MLSVIMLSLIMLSVIILSVIMLSIVAPLVEYFTTDRDIMGSNPASQHLIPGENGKEKTKLGWHHFTSLEHFQLFLK